MQSAFLIVSKGYSEKQVGVLFFVFGMSQFIFQTPAGYLMDYTTKKTLWLSLAGFATTALTIFTAVFAEERGANLWLMVFVKFLQGAVTSLIPPGLNSITQGIVGAVGMTEQVSMNEMMNHLGTAIIVLTASLIAFFLYPSIGLLFIVSPIAFIGFLWFLNEIRPEDIDNQAARGLTLETKHVDGPPLTNIASLGTAGSGGSTTKGAPVDTAPSFNFGWGSQSRQNDGLRAESPLQILRDPKLLTFVAIVFLFHVANGTILPLVMQSLAIGNGRSGILMSGLCIIVAQIFMVLSAKICGEYSGIYGRKILFLIGLFSVPVRCLILTTLIGIVGDDDASTGMQVLILATQILDGVGAGVFGTMYILVTSDISGGTGRFSLTLGLTTAAMSIGGTVSGYLGEALAQDIGYKEAFFILMFLSMVPAFLYLFTMPETLASIDSGSPQQNTTMISIKEDDEPEVTSPTWTKPTSSGGNYVEMT
jgi:MFS family permease